MKVHLKKYPYLLQTLLSNVLWIARNTKRSAVRQIHQTQHCGFHHADLNITLSRNITISFHHQFKHCFGN